MKDREGERGELEDRGINKGDRETALACGRELSGMGKEGRELRRKDDGWQLKEKKE